jgi:ketosteroid isomerase-like protein
MKKQTLVFAVLASILFSCSPKSEQKESATPSVAHIEDSLIGLWNDAWNRNDTTAIAAMFNDKSVVIGGYNFILTSTDSIMQKWVNKQVKSVANLQTQKRMGNSTDNMAYYSGTWTLDDTNEKDSVLGKQTGTFTSAWEKQQDGKWIMTTIQMGE